MKTTKLVGMVAAALAATAAVADVSVAKIFSDNMVLQRGKPIPVRGKADPGEVVTVEYAGQKATAKTSDKGFFRAVLPPLKVEKEGKELVVAGKNRVVFKNVVVGDVWLVSGQSNSEMSFSWGIINGAAEMAKAADYPNIRQVKFAHATSAFPVEYESCNNGGWKVATQKTLPGITAEGYFMAREINAKTGIPIGILDDNWSGCKIEPFVCDEGMKSVPKLAKEYEGVVKAREAMVGWCCRVAEQKKSGSWEEKNIFEGKIG